MSDEPTAFGIDLGTTFSVVAQVNGGGVPTVYPNGQGAPTTPSVVLFDGDDIVVGEVAREALSSEPELVVQLVKRRMGSQWTFEYRGVAYQAEHISALILRKLLQDAQLLAGPVHQAVITVPAYFNDAMRLATRSAGEMAGIDVLGLLSEPTAAAIAFGYDTGPAHARGLVVDLGGGTFDVTVMEYDGHELNIRGTGGDAYLGGANFDKILFDYFVEEFRRENGLDVSDPDALSIEDFTQVSQDWLLRATRAKHDLSSRERTMVTLQAVGLVSRLEVQRSTFEKLSSVLLEEMSEKMLDVLNTASVDVGDIDVVLAVGGSTRMPMVRKKVFEIFGKELDTSQRPDEAVALGAALFAARRQLEQGQSLVINPDARAYLNRLNVSDVSAHSLGVSVYDADAREGGHRLMDVMLARNTALPCDMSRTFYTMRAGETRVVVPVLQGEQTELEYCAQIGEVIIQDLPPDRPAHQPVVVTMSYDRDGILAVSARDESTGTVAKATIERSGMVQQEHADRAAEAVKTARIN